jgi:hypothetical protein
LNFAVTATTRWKWSPWNDALLGNFDTTKSGCLASASSCRFNARLTSLWAESRAATIRIIKFTKIDTTTRTIVLTRNTSLAFVERTEASARERSIVILFWRSGSTRFKTGTFTIAYCTPFASEWTDAVATGSYGGVLAIDYTRAASFRVDAFLIGEWTLTGTFTVVIRIQGFASFRAGTASFAVRSTNTVFYRAYVRALSDLVGFKVRTN